MGVPRSWSVSGDYEKSLCYSRESNPSRPHVSQLAY